MKLVVFSALKPPIGRTKEIQDKSFANWREVFPYADFVRFEGEMIPFNGMLCRVEESSEADVLLYANADILFDKKQISRLCRDVLVKSSGLFKNGFLILGQRIDEQPDGTKVLHRPAAMDYFIFLRGMFSELPTIWMGRAHCDSALVAYCLRRGIAVIDASFALRVEHQFHDYGHMKGGKNEVWTGEQAMENLLGNRLRPFGPHSIDATYTLLPDGRIVPNVRRSRLRLLELELYYKRGYAWCPRFNQLWNILTRGGKYWKNPLWDGVRPI